MDKNKKAVWLAIGNLISIFAVIIVNALASLGLLNGTDTGALSDALPNLFVPAGLTFSIWGLIYLFFLGFAGYNIYVMVKKKNIEEINRIGIWFILSSVGNFVWIFLWHWQLIFLSIFFMLLIAVSLIVIYLKLDIGGKREVGWTEKVLVHWTISFYLGWITVATIANVTAVLVNPANPTWLAFMETIFSQVTWTVIVIGAAGFIAILNVFTRKDLPYNLVVLWALLGIILKRMAVANFPAELGIVYAAALTMAYLVLCLGIKWVKVLTKRH
jgi:hypothetical protein